MLCLGHRQFRCLSGAVVTLLVGELLIDYSLREVVGPPSALLDEGLKEMLECYDKATSRPVSYTHLDVYKRQGLGAVGSFEGGCL